MTASFMRHLVFATSIGVIAYFCNSAQADDKASPPNQLAPLERFVGEWTVNGKWSSGDELHARNIYAWGLGNKIMTAKTFVQFEKGEYQRYEGVMAWHPNKKNLFIISFAYDGNMTENIVETKEDDTILIGFVPFHQGEPSKVRQTIKFKDKDHFTWKVELQGKGSWQELIDATWVRKTN
jgi:hypothetical protein